MLLGLLSILLCSILFGTLLCVASVLHILGTLYIHGLPSDHTHSHTILIRLHVMLTLNLPLPCSTTLLQTWSDMLCVAHPAITHCAVTQCKLWCPARNSGLPPSFFCRCLHFRVHKHEAKAVDSTQCRASAVGLSLRTEPQARPGQTNRTLPTGIIRGMFTGIIR